MGEPTNVNDIAIAKINATKDIVMKLIDKGMVGSPQITKTYGEVFGKIHECEQSLYK